MPRANFLDDLIARFRHRWETNPQYRAAMSGVLGLAVLLVLCSCMGVVSAVANAALASAGFSAGGSGGPANGPGNESGIAVATFPTQPVPTWQVSPSPSVFIIPDSQTPQPSPTSPPSPTAVPTDTPCTSNCGGGGGNVTITWAPNPSWPRSGNLTVFIQSNAPNTAVNIIVQACDGNTYLNSGSTRTDANGNASWTFTETGSPRLPPSATIQVQLQNGEYGTARPRCK